MSIIARAYNCPEDSIFRSLFGTQMTEVPTRFNRIYDYANKDFRDDMLDYVKEHGIRDRQLAYTFFSNDCQSDKSCRTYQTLTLLSEHYTYYTPNTFYRFDRRTEADLRFLNAIVLDVDVKNGQNDGLILPDLLDRISESGLPIPSLIVRTPTMGYHVHYFFEKPKKAYTSTIKFYKAIQEAMANAIGADTQAVGAARFVRVPTEQNIVYRTQQRTSLTALDAWREMNGLIQRRTTAYKGFSVPSKGLIQHKAIQTLLEGVEKGCRDNAAYTLALAFKADGFGKEDAEDQLQEWNNRLESPLAQRVITQKVNSAFKYGSPAAPSAKWIYELSGVPFKYGSWEPAKDREDRQRSHYHEWATDVLETLSKLPGQEIVNSQRKLADYWGMSLSTFQEVVCYLVQMKKIQVDVFGKGRGAKTRLKLVLPANVIPFQARPVSPKINVPVSNTFITLPGGGWGWPCALDQVYFSGASSPVILSIGFSCFCNLMLLWSYFPILARSSGCKFIHSCCYSILMCDLKNGRPQSKESCSQIYKRWTDYVLLHKVSCCYKNW